jgi:hypothetical protein
MHGLTGGDWKRAASSGTAPVPDPPTSLPDWATGMGAAAGDVPGSGWLRRVDHELRAAAS